MNITLDTDTSDCPGCVCKILGDDGQSILVQEDHQAPGVASSFGWSVRLVDGIGGPCKHDGTDGTVDCPVCGQKSGVFIESAREYLDDHDGEEIEDPGYFEEER